MRCVAQIAIEPSPSFPVSYAGLPLRLQIVMLPFPLTVTAPEQLAFRLLQDSDWAQSRLGDHVPPEFKTALGMVLDSPEPMWIAWGIEEKRFFFNDAYLPLLGGKLHGAMGAKLEMVWRDVWPDVCGAIDDAFAGRPRSFKNLRLLMDRDGAMKETFWTFSYSPIRLADGMVEGILCVVSEQTERVVERDLHSRQVAAITQEAREAHLELVRAREQLRQSQKLEAMGQLTGGVAHDFNNLLQIITGSVDMLVHYAGGDERQQRHVKAIGSAAGRAAKLTAHLLAFSRRQSLSPEVFDVAESIEALTELITTIVGGRISVTVNLPRDPLRVLLDRNQLDTALINLVVNARDATVGTGRVAIFVERVAAVPATRSSIPRRGHFVALRVSDTGSGMAPELLTRIFEPFFTTKGVGEGTGLGLSQVFGFVKQSEGEVDVRSEVGLGTTFTLYLPLTEQSPTQHTSQEGALEHGGGHRILVVEDNVDVAEFAMGAIASLGYQVTLASNAESALEELGRDASRFRAVFSDVVMPGISGLEMARAIRADHPRLPIVLTSGYSELLAKDSGHGFPLLRKPYSLKELSAVLAHVCEGS